jgi:hypothetical protein
VNEGSKPGREPAAEPSADQPFLREEFLLEHARIDTQVVVEDELLGEAGEPGKLPGHVEAALGGERCPGEQGRRVLAGGERPRLGQRPGQIGVEVGGKLAMVGRHGGEAGEEGGVGEIVARAGMDRLEVDEPRHEHQAVEEHPVLVLQPPRQAGRSEDTVTLAAEVFR